MALDIPSEPKVYTSVYDNFKGVDFTNDPSNVYRRRSPSGRNLLPDLDGRPFKRKGWKIDVSAEEFLQAFRDGMDECVAFITAKGSSATEAETERMETCQAWKESYNNVTPYKTYYFELGSIDYILVYNNLGVFVYDGDSLQYIWHYVNRDGGDGYFPKYVPTSSSDAKRGFFYEANGTAGFYLFNENVMFRLQLDNIIEGGVPTETLVLHEIKPFVPTAFISCQPATGAGTDYRPINILTRRRIRSYTCDRNNTVSRYKIPEGIQPDDYTVYPERLPTVRVIIGTQWVEIKHYARRESPSDKGYRIDSDNWEYIAFCESDGTTPFCPTDGEVGADNVTIEYEARNELQDSVKVLKRGLFTLARNDDGTWGYASSSGSEYSLMANDGVSLTQYGNISVPVDASGITNNENIRIYYRNQGTPNLWVALGESQNDYFGVDVDPYGSNVTFNSINNAVWNLPYKSDTVYTVNGKRGHRRVFELKFQYNPPAVDYNEVQRAFFSCTKFSVFGTGLVNQVFACGTQVDGYKSRLWYSMTGQPEYFPDTNYTEVGSNDTAIMGTLKCGEYLGVIKQGKTTDTSVYLAYPTSFENTTTYAVKQSISGIGAVSNGAFNVLNEEPLFLSADGVVGIELANEFRLRSRSHFINGRLTKEPKLSTAISFVFDNMYWLAVGGSCYVLDGTQKSSWANEKTNLQYECYYLDNIPAQCFAKMDNVLYWSDFHGNLCRFKTDTDELVYADSYTINRATSETIEYNTIDIPEDETGQPDIGVMETYVGRAVSFQSTDTVNTVLAINKSFSFDDASEAVTTITFPEETLESLGSFDLWMLHNTTDRREWSRRFSRYEFEYGTPYTWRTYREDTGFTLWKMSYDGENTFTFTPTYTVAFKLGGFALTARDSTTAVDTIEYPCYAEYTLPVLKSGSACELDVSFKGTTYKFDFGIGHAVSQRFNTIDFSPDPDMYFTLAYDGNRTISITNMCYRYDDIVFEEMACSYDGTSMGENPWLIESVNTEYRRFIFSDYTNAPVDAVWSTLADDDGMVHYFKNMKKKGCLVSLLPESDSGVEVWLKADEKEPVKIGETDVKGQTLPFEFYIKKKVKKYKRLQIICKNSGANDGFGIDQIIKSYTVGNYSKKRG